MKLGLIIPSRGRPDILRRTIATLASQRRIPDTIVISAVVPSDVPPISQALSDVRIIFGSAGLTRQRNRGISCLTDTMDVIAFIDDDFIVGDDYFLNMVRLFEQDDSIIGAIAEIIADGANSPGYTFEEGLRLAEQYRRRITVPTFREITGRYADGCNGIIAFRSRHAGSLRFDERLALYGWQEDLDFCAALRRSGRIVRTNLVWGVHLGTKRGKNSEVQLGYSQIVNTAYIVSKGNMSLPYAFRLSARNVVANLIRSIRPESYIDRRGRLWGNLIGMFHLVTGRLTPEHIARLK
jgi:glycosyltransferase involved in cell wall biosynthesis